MKRKQFIPLFAFVLTMGVSEITLADEHFGVIKLFHLNSDVAGRDACVRMNPDLPGTGWACVYNDNPLHNQISTLLRAAYFQGKPCTLSWNVTTPEGHANISSAQCGVG